MESICLDQCKAEGTSIGLALQDKACARGNSASYWCSQRTHSWSTPPSADQVLYQNAIAPLSFPALRSAHTRLLSLCRIHFWFLLFIFLWFLREERSFTYLYFSISIQ